MRPLLLVALILCLFLPSVGAHEEAGHGEIVQQTYRASGTVESGAFLEVDLEARGGDAIVWSVGASRPVNVNLHEHQMGTVYLFQVNGTRAANETFEVPHDGTFSLMVVGVDDAAAEVDVSLEGPFAIVGSQGLSEVGSSPAPGVLALLSLGALLAVAHRRRL